MSAGKKRCRPSKYGSARKASRGNALRPQPLSRVPSRRMAPRTPLAMRDCNFLNPVALRQRVDQRRQKSWIVLAVAIEGDAERRARRRDAAAHRRRLAARDLVLDLPEIWPLSHQRDQLRLGAVARSVVDIDDLEGAAGERRCDLHD